MRWFFREDNQSGIVRAPNPADQRRQNAAHAYLLMTGMTFHERLNLITNIVRDLPVEDVNALLDCAHKLARHADRPTIIR